MRVRIVSFVLAVCLAFQGLAQEADRYSREDLQMVEAARDAATSRLRELEKKGERARREAASIDVDLIAAAADSRRREEAAIASEARLIDLGTAAAKAAQDLKTGEAARENLLAALMSLGARPPPALATSPKDATDAIRAAILMSDAAPALNRQAAELHQRIDTLNVARRKIETERKKLAEAERALADRRIEIEALAAEKRLARVDLEAETATARVEIERLAAEAETLRQLLDGLAATAPASPERKPPAHKPSGKDLAFVAGPSPGPGTLALASPTARTRPALGQIVRGFNEVRDGIEHPGLSFDTRTGAQVVAPGDARIAFAGPFRSYGQMLILDTGSDNLVILSGLDVLYTEAGQWVLAGEPIGRMPDRKLPPPRLYLEVRQGGSPVDPAEWLGQST